MQEIWHLENQLIKNINIKKRMKIKGIHGLIYKLKGFPMGYSHNTRDPPYF